MTDPHGRFEDWLAAATPGDPPRDLALHASGCSDCLARAAALDALSSVDLGMAPEPPLHVTSARRAAGMTPVARGVAGIAAFGVIGVAVLLGANALLTDRSPAGAGMASSTGSPGEGVLGAAGAPAPDSPSASPALTARPTASESEASTPLASPTSAGASTPPPDATTPPGQAETPPAPPPTRTPTPSAATATPSPTPTQSTPPPSPTPTPAPTPTPTPTPSAPASEEPSATPAPTPPSGDESAGFDASCSNGVDDDGDLLADELDPGCVLGTRESDL